MVKAMVNRGFFDKIALIYVICLFIQPERILSNYLPGVRVINGIATPLLFLLVLLWAICDKSQWKVKVPLSGLLTFFVLSIAVSSFFARNSGRAGLSLVLMTYYLVFYYIVLGYYLNSQDRFEKLVKIYLYSIGIFGILGLKYGGRLSFIPELNNEDALGPFFTMAVSFPAFLSMAADESKKKKIYLLMTVGCVGVVIVCGARGATIALCCVLGYIFLMSMKKVKVFLSIVLVSIIVFGFFREPVMNTVYMKEVMSIFSEGERIREREGTGAHRMFLWKMGLRMFLTSPIIGIGPFNYGVYLPEYAEKYRDERVGTAYYGQILHNGYLEVLVGTGLVGFGSYLGLLGGLFQMNRKTRRLVKDMEGKTGLVGGEIFLPEGQLKRYYNLTLAIESSQIAFMVNLMFYGIVWYIKFFWLLLVIAGGLYMLVYRVHKQAN